ncbi:MAG: ABC transporter ATP-binding protein, partial [Thermoleophilia bacterium]|nr:ABC transporter ATP-binding protein [Thermoleophilia bacterium]
ALEAFPGTILLVSHDRALVDAVAERTLAVEGSTLRSYEGGWADLVRARAEREARPPPRPPRAKKAPATGRETRRRDPLAALEAEIEAQEALVATIEAKLAVDWTDVDAIAAHRRARDDLQELLARWEALFDGVAG